MQPIHFNLPPPQQSADSHKQPCFPRPSLQVHRQQCFSGPSALPHKLPAITRPLPPKSLLPRPVKGKPCLARQSVLTRPPLPCHLGKLPLHIPCPLGVNKATTVFPSKDDLLLYMSTLFPFPSVCANKETWMPGDPCSAPTTPSTPREELEAESLDSPDSQTSTALYSLCPRLPITYNFSHLQGRPQVIICNNLSIPFPSNSECSTDDTNGNTSSDGTDDPHGSPADIVADSLCLQRESPTTGTGMDMPTMQAVQLTNLQVTKMPNSLRKMPSHRHSRIPIGIRSFQDHSAPLTGSSNPASRTTKSSSRTVLITGPSSPTTQPADKTTSP